MIIASGLQKNNTFYSSVQYNQKVGGCLITVYYDNLVIDLKLRVVIMSGGDWKEMLVAVQMGNIDLVKYHISEGIDVNYEHPELMTTALIESIQFNQLEIAEILLEHGADPSQNAWLSEDNPLKIAKQQKKEAFIQLFRPYEKDQSLWSKVVSRIH